METAVTLLTVICYGAAIYLWWQWKHPIYLFSLLAGHFGALITPLWTILYGKIYAPEMPTLYTFANQHLYQPVVISYAWVYTLPGFIVLVLYQSRWWSPSYVMGVMMFGVLLFYHFLVELTGLNIGVWSYARTAVLPFGIENWVLSIIMAAVVSYALLYIMLLVFRFSWSSMLVMLIPAPFVLLIIVRGLLGAPLWISLMLETQTWATGIGVISTLALLAWAVHIVTSGVARVDREIMV